MHRRIHRLVLAGTVALTGLAVHAGGARAAAPASSTAPAGLPDGVPPAALRAEPALPVPATWPFPDRFPRTSGTGRLAGGAFEWSDFLYDDHGATGVPVESPVAGLANSAGTYAYPAGAASRNGADIFRVAVGATSDASYWRVDWNTLVDPNIPIAEFALDTDHNPTTGGSAWPAGAGVQSAGIDKAIVLSAKGAALIDTVTGATTKLSAPTVDKAARSFVLRIPRTTLPVSGIWTIRVAAGLANVTGDAFAPVGIDRGARPGEPAVYNTSFRTFAQEPETSNYWMESTQAKALTAGDVSAFSASVQWSRLLNRETTPEPQPTGYTNRWYVSSIELGQGVVPDSNGNEDLRPNFLGRVQPYAVYVPSSYDGHTPMPLTWILHSLSEQHNQYGSMNPNFILQACEQRRSICATTLGRGPDGWYFDEAELDFWEVWNRLATSFRLDAERTAISGYSMGGWGTYKLGFAHPDLFAKAVVLEGPVICGLRAAPGFPGAAGPGRCTTDGDSVPIIQSARNLPYVISQGAADELVPLPGMLPNVDQFDRLGYRYRFTLYPAADHLAYPVLDAFSDQAAHLDDAPRVHNPSHVTYSWYPNLDRADLGIGSTGAYWVRNTKGRTTAPGSLALVDAVTHARPEPAVTPTKTTGALVPGDPFPAVVTEQTWTAGATPARAPAIDLDLTNVGSLAIDLARAGFAPGERGSVTVTTDGPTTITLISGSGTRSVTVAAGKHTISLP